MPSISKVRNPRWGDAARTAIVLDLELDGASAAFVATPTDEAPYGRVLFDRAASGAYGSVADYQPGRD